LIRLDSLLAAILAIGVAAPPAPDTAGRRDRLTRISQRLDAGDASAIDELLACTQPVSPGAEPSEVEIERVRQDVARLRAASPASPKAGDPAPKVPCHVEVSLREARAWLRASDPLRCLEALSSIPSTEASRTGEVAFWRACALEQLGRDAEALEQYRSAAGALSSPVLKQAAESGADHVEWRSKRVADPEAKP